MSSSETKVGRIDFYSASRDPLNEALRRGLAMSASHDTLPDTSDIAQEPNSAADGAPTGVDGPVQQMSKNQQKKLAKKERFAANKTAMKLAEKAAKQADTARRRGEVQQKFAAMTEEQRKAWRLARQAKRQDRKAETEQKRSKLQQAMQDGQGIVIDLDFEKQMTETEIKSLCGQLQYCYSSNTRSAVPCHLYFTSLQGGIAKQADKQLSGIENWQITRQQIPYIDFFQERKADLVYLTADSPHELSELDSSKLYIIGGIVDRNRHKNICYNKAVSQDIQTAKLPIEAYIKLASSKVLTVNHVVEILLAWLECKDWKEAFFKVIPTRKRAAEDSSAADAGCTSDLPVQTASDHPDGNSMQADLQPPSGSVVDGVACCEQASCLPLDSTTLSQDKVEPFEKRTKLEKAC